MLTMVSALIRSQEFLTTANRPVLRHEDPPGNDAFRVLEIAGNPRLHHALFDAAGDRIAIDGDDGRTYLWDLVRGRTSSFLLNPRMSVRSSAFVCAGQMLAVAGGNWLLRKGGGSLFIGGSARLHFTLEPQSPDHGTGGNRRRQTARRRERRWGAQAMAKRGTRRLRPSSGPRR